MTKKVLHISDTPYCALAFIQELLERTQPDIVVHTGDLIDDLKIGRIPENIPAYKEKLPALLRLLQERKGRGLIVVPGNHDDAEFISRHVWRGCLLPEGKVCVLYGARFGFSHHVTRVPAGAVDFCLYGHGYTGDPWDPANNAPGAPCFFNGCRHATLIRLPEGTFEHIPYPEQILAARSVKK